MKRMPALIIALCLILSFVPIGASGAAPHKFTESVSGTVLQVLDGDSFLFRADDGRIGYVHFAGITTEAYDAALNFVTDELLGEHVSLVYDPALANISERWNYMYVFKGTRSLNELLLENGFARIADNQRGALAYSNLIQSEIDGKAGKTGIWSESNYQNNAFYTTRTLNINLAKASAFYDALLGFETVVESEEFTPDIEIVVPRIISRREKAPFGRISDIKFVQDFTKRMYDDNSFIFTVTTNINSATAEELASLESMDSATAAKIVASRVRESFSDIEDLKDRDLVTDHQYDTLEPFISTDYEAEIEVSVPVARVNINTATENQLRSVGMPESYAEQIINNRKNGYIFKHVGELEKFRNSSFTLGLIADYYDNLTVMTDINSASEDEIKSVLGNIANRDEIAEDIIDERPYNNVGDLKDVIEDSRYEKILPYIYVDSYETDYRNINLTTMNELVLSGFSSFRAEQLANRGKRMLSPSDIPFDVSNDNRKVALYTNINTASKNEILCLSNLISGDFADRILNYRKEQPFGSLDEIKDFFAANSASRAFEEIQDFIIVR